jgi:predicted membrane metal-binding protein
MAFSVIFNRRQNIFIGLSWSLVILSLLYPLCIFEAGVQLSYGAILGVLLGSSYANRYKKQDLETEVLSSLKLPSGYKEKFKESFQA